MQASSGLDAVIPSTPRKPERLAAGSYPHISDGVRPVVQVAREVTRRLIRTGQLQRRPCRVCGDPNVEAHHRDYGNPADIEWLCRRHHGDQHHVRKPKPPSKGKAAGGHARAASLSPERRREIARLAAAARWAKVRRRATSEPWDSPKRLPGRNQPADPAHAEPRRVHGVQAFRARL